MITISLCMIVKNEEKSLERCLSSVQKAVDQMIIVDTYPRTTPSKLHANLPDTFSTSNGSTILPQRATLRSAMRKWIIFYGWTRMIF